MRQKNSFSYELLPCQISPYSSQMGEGLPPPHPMCIHVGIDFFLCEYNIAGLILTQLRPYTSTVRIRSSFSIRCRRIFRASASGVNRYQSWLASTQPDIDKEKGASRILLQGNVALIRGSYGLRRWRATWNPSLYLPTPESRKGLNYKFYISTRCQIINFRSKMVLIRAWDLVSTAWAQNFKLYPTKDKTEISLSERNHQP